LVKPFVTVEALSICSTPVTASAIFKEYICRYAVLQAIISDQGTSFKNQLMYSLSQLLGYHHIFCTSYHLQSNGQVECFNNSFVTQLAQLTDEESNSFSTRSTVHNKVQHINQHGIEHSPIFKRLYNSNYTKQYLSAENFYHI
jgi:hypothetical protein